jgi:uncharacterized membrane protein (DUF106 family)
MENNFVNTQTEDIEELIQKLPDFYESLVKEFEIITKNLQLEQIKELKNHQESLVKHQVEISKLT